jgi:hypothetical protein
VRIARLKKNWLYLCTASGDVLIEKQPPILSLRLVDDGGRSTLGEDSDGHLIIDTSERQHHVIFFLPGSVVL